LRQRQREILQLVAEGHSSKQIAQILGASVMTIDAHWTNLMARLGIRKCPWLGSIRNLCRSDFCQLGDDYFRAAGRREVADLKVDVDGGRFSLGFARRYSEARLAGPSCPLPMQARMASPTTRGH
jgi:hypothetical protein